MADKLHAAMDRLGTNEDAVDEVLKNSGLSSVDIVRIMDVYEEKYGESLESDIKGDFSGKAQDELLEILENAEKKLKDEANKMIEESDLEV